MRPHCCGGGGRALVASGRCPRLAEDDEVRGAQAHLVEVGALDRQELDLPVSRAASLDRRWGELAPGKRPCNWGVSFVTVSSAFREILWMEAGQGGSSPP